ncbi:MAG: hypothetical protein ACJAV2_003212, partial [Myxococcota bacterium]
GVREELRLASPTALAFVLHQVAASEGHADHAICPFNLRWPTHMAHFFGGLNGLAAPPNSLCFATILKGKSG